MITLASRSGEKQSEYFKKLYGDLNKAKKMYESQKHPDDIVMQFSVVQDQVHSPLFSTMSEREKKIIEQDFVALGNRMMQ